MKKLLVVALMLLAGAAAWSAEQYKGVHITVNEGETTGDLGFKPTPSKLDAEDLAGC
jgi:hypothetical protein